MDKQEKFLGLFDSVYERLWRFILSLSRNRQDAKDILSETILIAYSNLEKLRNESSFKSYVFSIAVHEKSRFYRKHVHSYNSDPEILVELAGGVNDPEKCTELKLLYESLQKLPEKHREALILFEIHGFDRKEIANIQNTTIVNVKMRLYRARKELEQILK